MLIPKNPPAQSRIVLGGPIGSGKSAVGELLRAKGAVVLEADKVGHEILQPQGPAFPAVAARWPDAVVDDRIDRSRLAAVVFADASALEVLEALTHPHIASRLRAAADAAAGDLVVVELPLTIDLLGSGWKRLIVIAEESVRLARAVERGMEPGDVRRRMAAQADEAEWLAFADWVIRNDGSMGELEAAVDGWWSSVVETTAG